LSAILAAALGVTALAAPALAQTQPATGAPRPPTITVTTVVRSEVVASILVSGTVIARDEVLVTPQVDGLAIIELLAEEGQRVETGQVLARLNRAQLDVAQSQNAAQVQRVEAAIAQARAQITEADAANTQAQSALRRTQTLRSEGVATADTFDQRLAAARASEARLTAARQGLAIAEAELASTKAQGDDIALRIARSEIKAPMGGVVSRRNARLGQIAGMAAQEPLFRIIADGAVELEAEVPEADLPRLAVGKTVEVLPAGAREPLRGSIRLIAPEVDRMSRLGRVRIALPQAGAQSVGVFARGVIEIDRRVALTAPVSAITYRRDAATVQVVENDTVRTRPVRLGISGGGRVEIVEGVREGDRIVSRAGTFLRDGDVITPAMAALN
jgi:HlyD family secretion protein